MEIQNDPLYKFLIGNESISLIILSFLPEFFNENKLWNNLTIRVRFRKYSLETKQMENSNQHILWGKDSLTKNSLFLSARQSILTFFKKYLQTSCKDIFPFMNFSNSKIIMRMNLIITDEIPITINTNTMYISHQSLSYYTPIDITYKSNNSYDAMKNTESNLFASGNKTVYHMFPTRKMFAINDVITKNIKCKNTISFRTSNHEFVMKKNIDSVMISNSKYFIEYFIQTHFLHDVSNHIKVSITITKFHDDDDNINFDKIEQHVHFSINSNQIFYVDKSDMFMWNNQ